jgi:hypothetical protein
MINRICYYLPLVPPDVVNSNSYLLESDRKIRTCLLNCDLSSSLVFYRQLLHHVDDIYINDLSNISVTNEVPHEIIIQILNHFELRERVAGFEVKKGKSSDNP